jgi:2-polyprenyl-3-methyl-5-hydroxy-6-metoxy-1,4-benzoquinol methylase
MEKVEEFYNKYSYPDTNQYTNKQKKKTKKILRKILEIGNIDLEKDFKNKRILVAGCGTGEKVKELVDVGASVVAIDFSKTQINKAKKYVNNKKAVFLRKDIIKDNLFDLGMFNFVICLGVLHHTEDPKKGFIKLSSLLNNKGVIVLGLYHRYARIRYRILRKILRIFVSKDVNKLSMWIKKHHDRLFFLKASLSVLYDRYVVPYESYHTLKEIKRWFKKENTEIVGRSKNVNGLEILKMFERKTIFFVVGKRNL